MYTNTNRCECKGKDGRKKKLYRNKREACEQAQFAKVDRQVQLSIYSCPNGTGYHLTSNTLCY